MKRSEVHRLIAKESSMALEWPQQLPDWVVPPPDIALRSWRERLARVCEKECAHFAGLSYVKGLAAIGSVGHGAP